MYGYKAQEKKLYFFPFHFYLCYEVVNNHFRRYITHILLKRLGKTIDVDKINGVVLWKFYK